LALVEDSVEALFSQALWLMSEGVQFEQELKFRIADLNDFSKVLEYLGPVEQTVRQVNHYFCAEGESPGAGWSLRLRQKDNDYELTLKSNRRFVDGYFEADEVNAAIEPELAQFFLETPDWQDAHWQLAPLAQLRARFGVQRLRLLGSSQNVRHRCSKRSWGVPELDVTGFPDGSIDYELEVETAVPESVVLDLRPIQGLLQVQDKTKYRRFLERYR
jgi:uncharacterized protein YjbK